MKLAFVSLMEGVAWGGSEELWHAAAVAACRAGHKVSASVARWPQDPPRIAELEALGIRIHRRAQSRGRGRWMARFAGPTFEPILSERPDMVLINQGNTYQCVANRTRREFVRRLIAVGIPYALLCECEHNHPSLRADERAAAREAFGNATATFFLAHNLIDATERHLAMRPSNPIVVRNPVNLTDRSPVAWPTDDGEVSIACVARLEDNIKCQHILIETMARAEWRKRPVRVRLYGKGPDEGYLRELIAHRGVADRVTLEGHVDSIRDIWAQNRLLAMPSLLEGVPLSMVEAMLCGRPAVMTDVGGNREWIEDGESGFLAAAATVDAFSAAMERMWQARDRWPAMGERARARALTQSEENPGAALLARLTDRREACAA